MVWLDVVLVAAGPIAFGSNTSPAGTWLGQPPAAIRTAAFWRVRRRENR